MPLTPKDRRHLLGRLSRDLADQSEIDDWRADLGHQGVLENRIQDTARRLEPGAPEVAIQTARRKLILDDLAGHLIRRAELPAETAGAAESTRIRAKWQETRILDLARELEPEDPRRAIDLAVPRAQELITHQMEVQFRAARPALRATRERVPHAVQRAQRLATLPEPTPRQRIDQVLGDLRRLEQLDQEHRRVSQTRHHHILYRGNVPEIEAVLDRIPLARDLLEESVADIYRNPDRAIRMMRDNTDRHGLRSTIELFGEKPAAFGKLRGFHVSGFGDSPKRSKALDLAWHDSGYASNALTRRTNMERDLEAARSCQRLQTETRELIDALPGRKTLLTELSRHMEGLSLQEVRPLLRPGQERLVQDLRKAEVEFLEPLRKAHGTFRVFDNHGPQLHVRAQQTADLFRRAPRHILNRLTPPHIKAVMVAVAVAKRASKVVARAARV